MNRNKCRIEMVVLYICFTDFQESNCGATVRPFKMYQAFINKGYQVMLINGNASERRKKFLQYRKNNQLKNADYCYIEPSTYPCHPLDYLMFYSLKALKIPIGLFYRDMYYKFPELFNKKGIKKIELLIRYKIDWIIYKTISNTIFFPSDSMAAYFKFNNKMALPPAGEELMIINNNIINYNIIYVGGVSKRYGTDKLLKALQIVNKKYRKINLFLVCREYNRIIFEDYEKEEWLYIMHVSGEKLKQLYLKSDIAIIPIEKNEYNDFAVPVKLFEYLSYNMPIITTDCFETAKFVKENKIGIVVADNYQALADAIIDLYENPKDIIKFRERANNVLINGNLWEHRVEKIERHLISHD